MAINEPPITPINGYSINTTHTTSGVSGSGGPIYVGTTTSGTSWTPMPSSGPKGDKGDPGEPGKDADDSKRVKELKKERNKAFEQRDDMWDRLKDALEQLESYRDDNDRLTRTRVRDAKLIKEIAVALDSYTRNRPTGELDHIYDLMKQLLKPLD